MYRDKMNTLNIHDSKLDVSDQFGRLEPNLHDIELLLPIV